MPQTIDHAPAGEWNRFRPETPPTQFGLSPQAQTVYGWIAGILAFSIPWSDMVLLPYQVQFTRPLAGLAILSWLFSWRADNTVRRLGFPICAMLLFVMLVPAHFLTAEDTARTARRLFSYVGLFLMVFFFQQAIRSWQIHRFVLRCFIAGCCVPLVGLVWNFFAGVVKGDGRYSAPGFDPNDLAGQIALSIPIASYLAFNLAKGAIWFRLYLPFAVVGILLTASRTGVVALLLVSVYPALCLLRRTERGKVGMLAAMLCTGGAVYYFSPSISFHRLATMRSEVSRRDMNGRGTIWNNGMRVFWENPVIGIGAGGFAGSLSGDSRIAAHNTYLEVMVEHGIIGLTVFMAIVFGLFARTRRFPPDERLLWRVILGSWMALATTLSWENRECTWLIWGLCASFVARTANVTTMSAEKTLYAA